MRRAIAEKLWSRVQRERRQVDDYRLLCHSREFDQGERIFFHSGCLRCSVREEVSRARKMKLVNFLLIQSSNSVTLSLVDIQINIPFRSAIIWTVYIPLTRRFSQSNFRLFWATSLNRSFSLATSKSTAWYCQSNNSLFTAIEKWDLSFIKLRIY